TRIKILGDHPVTYRLFVVASSFLASLFIFLSMNGVARARSTADRAASSSTTSVTAAETGASLGGTVTDQSGAPLPGVAVTIKNVKAGETRIITTDGEGHY